MAANDGKALARRGCRKIIKSAGAPARLDGADSARGKAGAFRARARGGGAARAFPIPRSAGAREAGPVNEAVSSIREQLFQRRRGSRSKAPTWGISARGPSADHC